MFSAQNQRVPCRHPAQSALAETHLDLQKKFYALRCNEDEGSKLANRAMAN